MAKAKKRPAKRKSSARSSITGRKVTKRYARKHPRTTVIESDAKRERKVAAATARIMRILDSLK
jgi:hypothetical protein